MGRIIGIDASRNRSGGARAHLIGVLRSGDPRAFGIEVVHVWAHKALSDLLPDQPWLVKHSPAVLEKSILVQLIWQYFFLPLEFKRNSCSLMLNTDAGTISPIAPAITMSRDMLSFEEGELNRFSMGKEWLRLWLLRHIQARSLRKSKGVIFLTNYAKHVISRVSGPHSCARVIPHGVGRNFASVGKQRDFEKNFHDTISCVYVSNANLYKHQWNVIEAIASLRDRGVRIKLTLIGGGSGPAADRVLKARRRFDPDNSLVRQLPFIDQEKLPKTLGSVDIFIFASSCENMPNTLLEGMAAGSAIACSTNGPMPEVLGSAGLYFDPEKPASIANAVNTLIENPGLAKRLRRAAFMLSEQYSWERCATETWQFISDLTEGEA